MRACAKVAKFAVAVHRNLFALGNVREPSELKFLLPRISYGFFGGGAVELYSLKFLVLGDDFFHLGLDFCEIFACELVLQIKIVVEAVFGRRTDIELCVGEKAQYGRRQNVRGAVPYF